MLLILRWLVALVVVLLFAVSVAPLVETQWWAVRLLAFPRLPETIVIVIAILLVPLLIRGRLLLLLGVEAVAVAALAINIWTLWAYSPFQNALSRSCSPQARLSVMIANVQLGNRESGPLIDMVEQQKPDLFLAMETDEWWDDKLKVLAKTMPNATQKITGSYYGMNLFSRFLAGLAADPLPRQPGHAGDRYRRDPADRRDHSLSRHASKTAAALAIGRSPRCAALCGRPAHQGRVQADGGGR